MGHFWWAIHGATGDAVISEAGNHAQAKGSYMWPRVRPRAASRSATAGRTARQPRSAPAGKCLFVSQRACIS